MKWIKTKYDMFLKCECGKTRFHINKEGKNIFVYCYNCEKEIDITTIQGHTD